MAYCDFRAAAFCGAGFFLLVPAHGLAQAQQDAETAETDVVEEIIISTTRVQKSAASLPIKVNVFDEEQVRLQQTLATNPTEILANLIPSFSPSRQKLTGAGESFRGRKPLFLIDGVPQSNPLRDSSRDGVTLDAEVIERIEVVFGANAIQGLGATGGIINFITVSPPESGAFEQKVSLTTTINDDFDDQGFGVRAFYRAGKRVGEVDILGAVSFESRGLQFDGDNEPIGLDNVQGDVADSDSRNFFGKIGWEPDADQRLQFTINDFKLEQDGDFVSVDGDRDAGIPATSAKGDPEGIQPINDVTTMSASYEHDDLYGGRLSAQVYYQNFAALFGGGTFGTFQDPDIAPVGTLFDQSETNSRKWGTRLTYARSGVADLPLDVIAGFDFLRDLTFQELEQSGRNWVPETTFRNWAPFAQLDLQATEWLSLSGGLRWEVASLDIPTFETVAGNRDDFQPVTVQGGQPDFDEPLFNVGGTLTPIEPLRLYASFAEAFTMPDVGRVLRGISEPGLSAESFLDLEPITTDNLEFGAAYETGPGALSVTYFQSTSGLGSRLVPNADGIFEVRRQPTETSGWEIAGRIDPLDWLSVSAGYSLLDGEFDGDGDGDRESDLGASDIGPDRLNVALEVNPEGPFSARLQTFSFFDETFRDGAGAVTAEFEGYTTVDSSVSADLGLATATLAISNLLDEQFITFFGQAATNRDDRFFSGRGRTISLRLAADF